MKRISETAWELLLGILILGIVIQVVGIPFATDIWNYSIGLWIGITVSVFMVFHMQDSIEKALDSGEEGARKAMIGGSAIRNMVILIIILLMFFLKFGNLLTYILGLFTLKVAAYLQPITHNIIRRVRK